MEKELTDKDVMLMMKNALEYNAGVVALCTNFYGNVDSKRNAKKLSDGLLRISKVYREQIEKIIGSLERQEGNNEDSNR